MKLQIGFPMFNEEENVRPLLDQIAACRQDFEQLGYDTLSVLAIDNGSVDRTRDILLLEARRRPELRVISLSRNFSYESAVMAFLDHAEGDVIVLMDGDLQDPPHVVPRLLAKLAEGYDVVYAVRETREETSTRRYAYAKFYRVWSALSSISVPLDAGNFSAMRRPVIEAIRGMRERQRFLRGLRAWVGFRQAGVPYDRPRRHAGLTKFPFRSAIALAADGILSFSILPIRIFLIGGCIVLTLTGILAVYLVAAKLLVLIGGVAAERFPVGLVQSNLLIMFFSAMNLIGLGIIGEYVGRIYEELKGRPHYIVRHPSPAALDTESA